MQKEVNAALRAFAVIASVSASVSMSGPLRAQEGQGVSYAAIPPDAFSVVAQVRAKPGKADELRTVTLPLIAQVRSDPKNLVYFLQEDREAPGHFIFYEVFANEADFNAHNAMPYVKEWFKKIETLADGGVVVMKMKILKAGDR